MRVISTLLAGAVLAVSSLTATAAPIDERTAGKILFSGDKFRVQLIPGAALDATTMAQVEALVKALQNPQMALMFAEFGYYGAIAVMPGRGISEDSMSISAKLHNPQAAAEAAVRGCNELDGPNCVPVALILPKRYKAVDFSLSQVATDSFRGPFGDLPAPKYLAYSPTSAGWAAAAGPGAEALAVEQCNVKAAEFGPKNCVIGIAEE